MEDYRININYAKALFLTAEEAHCLDEVAADMKLVGSVCSENRVLNAILANPTIHETKKASILHDIFEGKVSKATLLFMSYVVRKRRAINLKGISKAFTELYRIARNIVLTTVTTASEPTEEAREAVRKLVGDYTGKEVELESITDAETLGGFSIMFDNYMYDARLSTQVMKLQREFAKNAYESLI